MDGRRLRTTLGIATAVLVAAAGPGAVGGRGPGTSAHHGDVAHPDEPEHE